MSTFERFDAAVIGAGPGGYVAAIRLAQGGKSVALIEKEYLGGVCLNCGCIPTKTLISSSEIVSKIKKADTFGIQVKDLLIDFAKMKSRKDQVVDKIKKSLEGLLLANKIKIIKGTAEFASKNSLKILGENPLMIEANSIIIATGSKPLDISAFPCDHERIFNSTSILEQTKLPKSLVVIGGGYIGCEFASLYRELGVQVTIVEALPSIISLQGATLSNALTKRFAKMGIQIETNVQVKKIDKHPDHLTVLLSDGREIQTETALVSIGRSIDTRELKLENAGLSSGSKGEIAVNSKMETAIKGIYAIGDVTMKAMLAHVASHQGLVAADNILGKPSLMHYHAVPAVIFTHPEIATVGYTLDQAKNLGYSVKSAQFPLQALGKAQAMAETDGFVEIVYDTTYHQILGAQIFGSGASDLIGEMTLAIQNELTLENVAETIHAHPTIAEGWMEAALIGLDTPVHFPPKKGA
jgi:dihydrolipoamide dehydrogenase